MSRSRPSHTQTRPSPAEALLRSCTCLEFGGAGSHFGSIVCSSVPTAALASSVQQRRSAISPYCYYYNAVARLSHNGILLYRGDQTTFFSQVFDHYGVPSPNVHHAAAEIHWDDIEDVREEPVIGATRIIFTFTAQACHSRSGLARLLSGFVLDVQSATLAEALLEAVKIMSVETTEEKAAACSELVRHSSALASTGGQPASLSSASNGLSLAHQKLVEAEIAALRQRETAMREEIHHVEHRRGSSHRSAGKAPSEDHPEYRSYDNPSHLTRTLEKSHSLIATADTLHGTTSSVVPPPFQAAPTPPSANHSAPPNVLIGDTIESVRRQVRDDSIQREVMATTTVSAAPYERPPHLLSGLQSLQIANDVTDLLRLLEREENEGRRHVTAQRERLGLPNEQLQMSSRTQQPNLATTTAETPSNFVSSQAVQITPTAIVQPIDDTVVNAAVAATQINSPRTDLRPGDGWRAIAHKESGKTYYVNKMLNRTTWKLSDTDPVPVETADKLGETKISSENRAVNEVPPSSPKAEPPVKTTPAPPVTTDAAPSEPSPTATKAPPPPPPPAKKAPPPPPPVKTTPAPPVTTDAAPSEPSPTATKAPPPPPPPAKKAPPPPPPAKTPNATPVTESDDAKKPAAQGSKIYGNFKEMTDPKTGRLYYCNLTTKEVKWAVPPEVAQMKAEEAQGSQLPLTGTPNIVVGTDGLRTCGVWKERRTPEGRLYYVNTETKATTWKVAETPFS